MQLTRINNNNNNQQPQGNRNQQQQPMPSFYPLEINGTKYLLCKLPEHSFSTLHDPETKKIVGQWNDDDARYEITDHIAQWEMINDTATATATATDTMTDEQFHQHMRGLIASGAAFTPVD